MSYPYKTEHKEMSLHCNFLTIKHYYRKMKGACIIISFFKSLTSQGVYDFPYQSSSLLPIEAFPSLIALRHILQHRYHFLAKALRSKGRYLTRFFSSAKASSASAHGLAFPSTAELYFFTPRSSLFTPITYHRCLKSLTKAGCSTMSFSSP